MPSEPLRSLRRQVSVLARALLPKDLKKDILELPPRLSVRALSFRLLCHAEIESYFEARSREIATLIVGCWNSSQMVSYPTVCMLGFSGQEMTLPPPTVEKPSSKQKDWEDHIKVGGRIRKSIDTYLHYVNRQNNGIDEKDLLRMLLPLGFRVSLLDEAFLIQINNFVKGRGDVAHNSVLGQVTKGVDPRDEFKNVQSLLGCLIPIDAEFDRLMSLIR